MDLGAQVKNNFSIKFMINNVQFNFKAKYNESFENFLNKTFKYR